MDRLEVPGASLYYETVGKGPVVLCISGADGSCDGWRDFAQGLQKHFTVIMWDRRGFSRSKLQEPTPFEERLQTDADDAARLIRHVSPENPVTVIANSSGAIVSLKLLVSYPDIIQTLLCYEPPLASILPDFDSLWKQHEAVHATYRRWGVLPALRKFTKMTKSGAGQIVRVIVPRSRPNPMILPNTHYWFEHEFMNYPKADFDVDRDFRLFKDKLILVNGEKTDRTAYQWRANELIGKRLDLDLTIFPGEHLGYLTHSKAFAKKFLEVVEYRI